jgi:RND family efflux transporter MFP subunit
MRVSGWAVVAVVAGWCAALGVGCGGRHKGGEGAARRAELPAGPPVPVQTLTVALLDAQQFNEFAGTVQSRVTVEVSARIAAHILELPVRSGDKVKQGDLLARLDDRDVQARVRQVEAALLAAKAALTETEADFKRYQTLLASGASSRQEFEQAQMRHDTAKAGVSQVEEQLKEAQLNLGYTEIRSPIDGIVVDKHAESGDLAAPGRSLVTLQKPTELWLEAPVSEACARRIHVDDPVHVRVDALDEAVGSQVTEIVPAVDPRSRSFLVRATLPANPALQPGMFGRLQFACEQRQLIAVPPSALVRRGQLDYVFGVQNDRAQLRLVRCGREFQGGIEVLAGVSVGDTLIVNPPPGLRDLDPVTPAAPAAPAAPATAPAREGQP